MKAVMYMRVSGASQIDGNDPERQRQTIQAYAASHDYQTVGVYEEKGVSGQTDIEERPAFMQMLAELLSNGCRSHHC